MHRFAILVGVFLGIGLSSQAHAAGPLTYRYNHYLFTISAQQQAEWYAPEDVWMYGDVAVSPPQEFRSDGDRPVQVPAGFTRRATSGLNTAAIVRTIENRISSELNRPAGSVVIKGGSGAIQFEGVGLPGRHVDSVLAAQLTKTALETGADDIVLPVEEIAPTITVTDPALRARGIKEVVTVGESDFSNSPVNRRFNIKTGMAKFNGHLIPQGTIFSFGETLGPVNGATGFLKELVIKGERTEPDYGGGLCQVSTTAYRGIWEYGLPIVQRKNHSYTVSHYFPSGTDATVYPPTVDMKFRNDTPADLLMQTHIDGDAAYFVYYGTKDDRESMILGPFTWAHTTPPPDKEELTLEIPPGERKKVGSRVPGLQAAWFRVVKKDATEHILATYSSYQARPLYYLVGVAELPKAASGSVVPGVSVDDFAEH